MQYYTDISTCRWMENTAVTLGKFDSLHLGHQKLISEVKEWAQRDALKSVVFAFDMGKSTLLTNEERRLHLEQQVDYMIECPFTKEIREMEAVTFIEDILVRTLHASCIIVGKDFRFGHGKRGDAKMLEQYSFKYGYRLEVLDKEMYNGREISSTYVREALEKGEVSLAKELLGYGYHMSGTVQHGKRLGRTLGFPTMNIRPSKRKIIPRFGVYTCRICLEDTWYFGIGNVGIKPTVTEKNEVLLEVFVFDYQGDAYDKNIKVEFCSFIRPELKFAGIAELKEQVDRDIASGLDYFQKSI